eukprot:5983143-Amphidinium_carterae.1
MVFELSADDGLTRLTLVVLRMQNSWLHLSSYICLQVLRQEGPARHTAIETANMAFAPWQQADIEAQGRSKLKDKLEEKKPSQTSPSKEPPNGAKLASPKRL